MAETMLGMKAHVESGGVDRHRTVEIHRQILGYLAQALELPQIEQQRLGTPDGKGRNHHLATACNGAIDHLGQLQRRVGVIMPTVAIGRLEHQPIRGGRHLRYTHDGIVGSAEIAGENDAAAIGFDFRKGRAKNMPARLETKRDTRQEGRP